MNVGQGLHASSLLYVAPTPSPFSLGAGQWVKASVVDGRILEHSKTWISVVFSVAVRFLYTKGCIREKRPCSWGLYLMHCSLCVYVLLFPPPWLAYPGTERYLIPLEYTQVMLLSFRRISTHEEHLALKDIPSYFVTQFPNGPEGSRKENFVPSQHFLPP